MLVCLSRAHSERHDGLVRVSRERHGAANKGEGESGRRSGRVRTRRESEKWPRTNHHIAVAVAMTGRTKHRRRSPAATERRATRPTRRPGDRQARDRLAPIVECVHGEAGRADIARELLAAEHAQQRPRHVQAAELGHQPVGGLFFESRENATPWTEYARGPPPGFNERVGRRVSVSASPLGIHTLGHAITLGCSPSSSGIRTPMRAF